MELLIRNADGNLPPQEREYAAKKLGRLDRYLHQAQKVEIVHSEQKLYHLVQVTVFADGLTLRGEEKDQSLHAAIDLVAEKLEQRLRKVKRRLVKNHHQRGVKLMPEALAEPETEEPVEDGLHISAYKSYPAKPMELEEAVLQMELLGHTFFVFRNERGATEVLYRRTNGSLGLLSPEA